MPTGRIAEGTRDSVPAHSSTAHIDGALVTFCTRDYLGCRHGPLALTTTRSHDTISGHALLTSHDVTSLRVDGRTQDFRTSRPDLHNERKNDHDIGN